MSTSLCCAAESKIDDIDDIEEKAPRKSELSKEPFKNWPNDAGVSDDTPEAHIILFHWH
jgi:hypothetical protein